MKKDIHPQVNPVVFIDASTGKEFVAKSSITSNETRNIDGVEHFVIKVDISSDSHPFFTGEQKIVDATGRVEKFRAKYNQAK